MGQKQYCSIFQTMLSHKKHINNSEFFISNQMKKSDHLKQPDPDSLSKHYT